MNAFLLLLPLLLIRYGLSLFLNKEVLTHLSHYPSFPKNKQIFLFLYQGTTILLLIVPLFLKIQIDARYTYIAFLTYFIGIILLLISTIDFSKPNSTELKITGLYRFSRNPMYMGYFMYFFGCTIITKSLVLFIVLIVFQVSSHWLIIAEEKWCIEYFGDPYEEYRKKVRRYF